MKITNDDHYFEAETGLKNDVDGVLVVSAYTGSATIIVNKDGDRGLSLSPSQARKFARYLLKAAKQASKENR